MTSSIPIQNEELVSVRDAMRTLPTLLRRLENGELDKFVLMKHGKMVGVLVTLDTFEELNEKSKVLGGV